MSRARTPLVPVMRRSSRLSLRGPKKESGEVEDTRKVVSFRADAALRAYIAETAKETDTDASEVCLAALKLDRDLAKEMEGERVRMQAFAESQGLRMHEDLAVILARLLRRGLDGVEKDKKGKGQ